MAFILPPNDIVTVMALWLFLPFSLLLMALFLTVTQCCVPPSPGDGCRTSLMPRAFNCVSGQVQP